ncbi:MFS transporter [Synechococcus sp. PCC 7336]|uniref:MFS transporter n=1 Tax=Synechococcus sp. PCC 7336 TaxID=195250 RepID=UPI000345B28F|nr:MFS transporter [Synechococcus sp. PCC 7336]
MTSSSESKAIEPRETPPSEKLSLVTKLAFGVGDMGAGMTATIMVFYLLFFLTEVAGLPPGLAGTVLLVGKAWDAINDPIIGSLSDRTKSRWGRRHSWMLCAAIPFGLFFFIGWMVPDFGADIATNPWPWFWYYAIVAILFHTFYTCFNLPYAALTPELTEDYNERTSLNSFRFTFSISGSILALVMAQVIFGQIDDLKMRFVVLAGAIAVMAVIPIFLCVWGTEERYSSATEHGLSYFEQIKVVFSTKAFLFVIGIYLASWLSFQLTASIIPFYAQHWMGMEDPTPLAITVQGTAIVMLFVWSYFSRKLGKRMVYFLGMSLWIVAQIFLFFLPQGDRGFLFFLCFLAGIGISTAYLIPWSMIPDVIDQDELNTGERREGVFYAFMVLLQKLGLAIGLFMVGQALEISGFNHDLAVQPDSALMAIRVAIGPLPLVFLICGLILAYFYPITRKRHAEILKQLHERKGLPAPTCD